MERPNDSLNFLYPVSDQEIVRQELRDRLDAMAYGNPEEFAAGIRRIGGAHQPEWWQKLRQDALAAGKARLCMRWLRQFYHAAERIDVPKHIHAHQAFFTRRLRGLLSSAAEADRSFALLAFVDNPGTGMRLLGGIPPGTVLLAARHEDDASVGRDYAYMRDPYSRYSAFAVNALNLPLPLAFKVRWVEGFVTHNPDVAAYLHHLRGNVV